MSVGLDLAKKRRAAVVSHLFREIGKVREASRIIHENGAKLLERRNFFDVLPKIRELFEFKTRELGPSRQQELRP